MAKERPQLVLPDESASVEAVLKCHPQGRNYRSTVKNRQVIVYEGIGGGMDGLREILNFAGARTEGIEDRLQTELDRYTQFTPVMRLILDDQETRQYHAERCRIVDAGCEF